MVLFSQDMLSSHIGGCIAFGLCAALAMSAGIGGGGLFVPLLMIILGKSVTEATSMSQCLIAGAAIAGLTYNSQQCHPTRKSPLILLDAVVFFAPLQMSGALMGNVLNQMLPKYLIVMILVVVLSVSAVKSFMKGLQLWRKEAHAPAAAQEYRTTPTSREHPYCEEVELSRKVRGGGGSSSSPVLLRKQTTFLQSARATMTAIMTVSEVHVQGTVGAHTPIATATDVEASFEAGDESGKIEGFDMKKVAMLFSVWCMTMVLIFARGGKGADSVFGLVYCGGGYWAVSGVAVIGLMLFSVTFVAPMLIKDTAAKIESGYKFEEGDLVWTSSLAVQLGITTLFAGIMAGLVGIGGGMVLGPVLLEAGYIPQVSSALTATNVLLSSSTVGVLVLVSGVVPIDESMFFFLVCLTGAFLGKFYLGRVIKKLGRTSIIIFMLVSVICLSIIAVLAKSVPVWAAEGLVGGFTAVCADS